MPKLIVNHVQFRQVSYTLILAIFFAGCNLSAETTQYVGGSTNAEKGKLISMKVTTYLSENFAGWEIATETDYIKSWWSFYDRGNIPYAVKTDINDDKYPDYGIIIKKGDSIKLVVLTGNGTSFNHWVANNCPTLFNSTLKNLHIGLSIEPPGRIDIAYPQIKSLILKSNAINLMDYENRLAAYYWEDNKIQVFQTN